MQHEAASTKVGTGKHLGFVVLVWAVFFVLAAWVLPPLDSHLRPGPLVYWGQRLIAELGTTPITRRLPYFKAPIDVVLEIPAVCAQSWQSETHQ
jgi:hypothetical protein